jgi:hypothetical protein
MKKTYLLPLFLSLFLYNGCELSDKVNREIDRISNQYQEYTGDKNERGERPFPIIYQQDENDKTVLITSSCSENNIPASIYFETQDAASAHIHTALSQLYSYPFSGIFKPFWDIRYINPVTTYISGTDGSQYPNHASLTGLDTRSGNQNIIVGTGASQTDASGSLVQSKCIDGQLAGGTTLNLNDAPEQELIYAGIISTFTYQIHNSNYASPWRADSNGNLLIQSSFDTPLYQNFESNKGGSVVFNVFLYNAKIKKHLNYVIGIYAAGTAWQEEKAGIRYDPTTNIIHVATVISADSWWSTISPKSNAIQEVPNKSGSSTKDDGKWNKFFRVNISYHNLLAVLQALQQNPPAEVAGENFGLNPEDWQVMLVALQYELEETGGKATLSGSFKGFEAYISDLPL